MAKTETVLSVFVASPADVAEERAALQDVIAELNNTWSNDLNIRLNLVRWETHAYPGISSDPQAVINDEIPNDYDVFLGIAWTRLGTPTDRAESGMAEEFQAAYTRFKENPDQIRIMFYFKEKPISPTKLDIDQFSRLKDFREKLGEQGTLYWTFSELEDFKTLARVHLSRQVQTWGKKWGPKIRESTSDSETPAVVEKQISMTPSIEEEEEGFLDLIEDTVTNLGTATKVTERIAEAIGDLGKRISEHAAKLNQVNADKNATLAVQKKVTNQAADDMEQFVSRVKAEIPIYSEAFLRGMHAYSKAATLLPYFHTSDYSQLEQALQVLDESQDALKSAIDGTMKLRQSVAYIPPATTQFNRAKRHTMAILDEYLSQLERSGNLLSETQNTMRQVLNSAKTN